MEPYIVTKSEMADNGMITHTIVTKGDDKVLHYHDVRGGLSWPTEAAPGYYCILGEKYSETYRFEGMNRRGELRLLAEREFNGISLNDLFAQLTDDTAMLECRSIYTDTEEPFKGHVETFWEFVHKKGVKTGSLTEAPFVDNFLLGISWIQDWVKEGLLSIPETSVIYSQLKTISKADLAESPEDRFPAINALRFVVGAFYKYRTGQTRFTPNRSRYVTPRRASWGRR